MEEEYIKTMLAKESHRPDYPLLYLQRFVQDGNGVAENEIPNEGQSHAFHSSETCYHHNRKQEQFAP